MVCGGAFGVVVIGQFPRQGQRITSQEESAGQGNECILLFVQRAICNALV